MKKEDQSIILRRQKAEDRFVSRQEELDSCSGRDPFCLAQMIDKGSFLGPLIFDETFITDEDFDDA